jgi:hypothetical protein
MLSDVRDAARAYIALLRAEPRRINGQIFNVVYQNFRISELALRVREALTKLGVRVEIETDYTYRGIRNYRVSGRKLLDQLKFQPSLTVEESVRDMVENIRRCNYTDFDHPRYYNVRWMRLLEQAQSVIRVTGSVWEAPPAGGSSLWVAKP